MLVVLWVCYAAIYRYPWYSVLGDDKIVSRILFERSEFLIDTPHNKNLRVCPCAACTCQIILVLVCTYVCFLVLVWKNCLGFSVGYQRAPGTSEKRKERLVPASASLPTAGSAFPPVGRATPLLWCSDVNTKQQFLLWGRPPK